MAKDLGSFIRELIKVAPEEISEVKKTVDPKFEATALLRKLELEDRRPMVIFRNPKNLNGGNSLFPLTFNTFATRKKLAVALGLEPTDCKMGLSFAMRDRFKTPLSPIIIAALGEPLRLVPSETLGNDFLVPADAEIVIEGYILPGEKGEEGPVGEHTRYYKTIKVEGEAKDAILMAFTGGMLKGRSKMAARFGMPSNGLSR